MYELKTLLPKFDIELPTCMYTLRSNALSAEQQDSTTTRHCNGSAGPGSSADGSSHTSEIEQRQEKVLQQLNELKSQLAGIRSQLGLCQKGVQHTAKPAVKKDDLIVDDPLHDIVINSQPTFIPYSLLALKNAWKGSFNIDVKVFAHSSISNVSDEAREFEKKLCASSPSDPSKRGIKITLIWTNCEHTEMIMSPTMYVPIYGEVNIIRYLGRVGPAEYRYEQTPLCNEIDLVLDICYELLRCSTPKSKADIIRILNTRLQKEQYFGGSRLSVADIGCYSTFLRMKLGAKELTPALKEWRERVKAAIQL
ncbi:probable aminoacyl tRNA synthase complex-interacting multifunctional protein 2 isoform X2 [Episyrphus balteatus]|uniref:probable aminoacyl tRNA synthase complex-interacting multifunctional protein 2 isoform X2 n=1 Tax=Episyrphus balteatus TaxID=286459 RepID=UPI002484EDF6|nr:probable aminoacyl tRNA synthase complex-interacting multifunctional protein 2 isoform X2 [Episyrphus balteatus]